MYVDTILCLCGFKLLQINSHKEMMLLEFLCSVVYSCETASSQFTVIYALRVILNFSYET